MKELHMNVFIQVNIFIMCLIALFMPISILWTLIALVAYTIVSQSSTLWIFKEIEVSRTQIMVLVLTMSGLTLFPFLLIRLVSSWTLSPSWVTFMPFWILFLAMFIATVVDMIRGTTFSDPKRPWKEIYHFYYG